MYFYLCMTKDEIFEKIKVFKVEIQNQNEKKGK